MPRAAARRPGGEGPSGRLRAGADAATVARPLCSGPVTDTFADTLRSHGVHPSVPRVEIARVVLVAHDHPAADEVLARVRTRLPDVSRATVYNTLNLLVRKGLVRRLHLIEGRVVFDPRTEPHHHVVDEATGRIDDLPWDRLRVEGVGALEGLDVVEYQVVVRARRRAPPAP